MVPIKERFSVEAFAAVIMNFGSDGINEYHEIVSTLVGKGSYTYVSKNVDLNLKNRVTPPAKPSIEEPFILNLKLLLSHLHYVFLGVNKSYSIIIVGDLLEW